MSMKTVRIVSVMMVFTLLIALTGCSMGGKFGSNSNDDPNKEYYRGSEGVRMTFANPSDPPSKMYYYSRGAQPGDHDFAVAVDLHNIGGSYTRGGVYISGYDPYLIHIEDINIPKLDQGWGDCTIDFNMGGIDSDSFLDTVSSVVSCEGVGTDAYFEGDGRFGMSADSLGPLAELLGIEAEVLDNIGFDYNQMGDQANFGFSVDDDLDFNLFNHGRGLLMMLSGISFDRYNGKEFYLRPDDPDYPGGEMETLVFNGELQEWTKGVDKRTMRFMVTNCYLYSTYASPMVCIDPAPMSEGRKVCRPREVTFNGGNGAPVAITRIEQENTRQSVFFDIHIDNIGAGTVFDMGQIERCSPYYPADLSTRYKDKVYVIDVRIGDQSLSCTPDRFDGVKLIPGQGGRVRCRYDLEYVTAKSAYETPLVVELGYGYSQTMTRQTTVKRV
ncbi:MAG: hypothetical protein ACQESC_00550 [Nanobdellota archaeon]